MGKGSGEATFQSREIVVSGANTCRQQNGMIKTTNGKLRALTTNTDSLLASLLERVQG